MGLAFFLSNTKHTKEQANGWAMGAFVSEACKEKKLSNSPAVAAVKYALDHQCDSPIEFLHCWYHGDFDTIRKEWENVPDEVFIGADPLFPNPVEFERKKADDSEGGTHD